MYADLDLTPLRKEILPVWECALKNIDDSLKDCAQSLINWIGSEKSLYHRVLRGEALRPNQPISQLTDAVLKYHGCDLKSDHNWLIILRQVINAGNELQKWNLALPAHSIVSPRERGRFNPDRFRSRKLAKIWKCALDKSFSRVDDLNHDQSIGRIILSAMLYGGITNTQLLISLIKNIPLKPTYHNGFRFIDLKPTWRGQDIAEVRRWFPDSLTETLILKFRDNINLDSEYKISGPWIHKKVNSFLKMCDVSNENLPSGISQLCDISCIQYELNFPPVIADYCARRFIGHSLRDCAWSRMSGPVEKLNDVEPIELSGWHKTQKLDEVNNESHPFKHVAFIGIREAIYSEKIQVASTQLKHHITTLDATSHSLEYLFSSWILYLFKPRNGNRAIKTSTARNYLSIIGSRLDEALSGESLVELSSDEFEEAYTLILDAIDSQNHKRRVAKTLYQFHRYVEKYHDITRIDYHGVLGSYSAPMPVDANVLWVDEFERIQASIRQSDLIQMHPDLVDVINLIFTLGYRCGLRRMEALRLRLIDLSGTYKPELLVRPFLGRRLKTNSSRRKVPLNALFTKEEIETLLAWKEKRLKQESESEFSEYLFAVKELNYSCAPEDLVFPIIHKAMRSVTGDPTLRYHHLRHSFGSLSILKLLAADYGAPLSLFSQLPKQRAEIEDATTFKDNLMVLQGPTRKFSYAVARLLGHSGPDISLEHYIHTLDIMVKHLCEQYFTVSQSVLVQASGGPLSTVYRWFNDGLDGFLRGMRKQHDCLPDNNKDVLLAQNAKELMDNEIEERVAIDRVNRVRQALLLHSKFELSVDDLAQRFNTTSTDIQICIDAAKALQTIRTNGPKSRRRFLFQDYKDHSCHKQITLCPKEPRRQSDKVLADSLIARLSALYRSEFNLYDKGLTTFKHNTWSTKYQVVLKTDEEVRDYLTFLDALNIPKSQIKLILLHGKRASETYIKNGLRYWKSAIPTSRSYQWNKHTSTDGARMSEHGWLGINILNSEKRKESSTALRYALTMGLIGCAYE